MPEALNSLSLSLSVFEIATLALLVLILLVIVYVALSDSGSSADKDLSKKVDALLARGTDNLALLERGFSGMREESARAGRDLREEVSRLSESLARQQDAKLSEFAARFSELKSSSEDGAGRLREELGSSFQRLGASVSERLADSARAQAEGLEAFGGRLSDHRRAAADDSAAFREVVGERIGALSDAVSKGLESIRSDSSEKLEQMRATVDEKLNATLSERFTAAFGQVSENLDKVHQSVGEMRAVASSVSDLKGILSNVKNRGTWGEVSLGMLLEQVLASEQYATNVEVVPESGQRVEFAVRLPGEGSGQIWLPIDAKFPTEDYERLVKASEAGNAAAVEEAAKGVERAIRIAARDICDKYVSVPYSTDFGVMFLPTEGLFAEVVRRPGLVDALQREFRVVVAGPTTLMALLTSLRMGFRTLSIQRRSSEVWQVLGAVKTEFEKFGGVLDKVQKKLGEAQSAVESAGVRRRAVDRRLRGVESLPEADAADILAIAAHSAVTDAQDEADEASERREDEAVQASGEQA